MNATELREVMKKMDEVKSSNMKYCVECDHNDSDVEKNPCKKCIKALMVIHDKPNWTPKKKSKKSRKKRRVVTKETKSPEKKVKVQKKKSVADKGREFTVINPRKLGRCVMRKGDTLVASFATKGGRQEVIFCNTRLPKQKDFLSTIENFEGMVGKV